MLCYNLLHELGFRLSTKSSPLPEQTKVFLGMVVHTGRVALQSGPLRRALSRCTPRSASWCARGSRRRARGTPPRGGGCTCRDRAGTTPGSDIYEDEDACREGAQAAAEGTTQGPRASRGRCIPVPLQSPAIEEVTERSRSPGAEAKSWLNRSILPGCPMRAPDYSG